MVQLYKGDCLELMKAIPSGSLDAIITDPPYGTTACKWDSVIPFGLMWEQLNRIIKPNGAIVLFGSEPFSSALRMSNIKNYKYDWIWEKPNGANFLVANYQPLKNYENILVFSEGATSYTKKGNSCPYYPQESVGKAYTQKSGKQKTTHENSTVRSPIEQIITINDGTRKPKTIIKFTADKNKIHPTQKPVELMEYLIKTYTLENELVLDFTMGSGSTGVACVNTNRNFIGIEMDEKYFNIATKRIEEAQELNELLLC